MEVTLEVLVGIKRRKDRIIRNAEQTRKELGIKVVINLEYRGGAHYKIRIDGQIVRDGEAKRTTDFRGLVKGVLKEYGHPSKRKPPSEDSMRKFQNPYCSF